MAAAAATPWPGDKASALSVLFLSWLDPLLWLGFRKPLGEDDVYAVPERHASRSVRERVLAFQARHPEAPKSFTHAILRTFALRWLAGFMTKSTFVVAYLLQPFWVGSIVAYINDKMLGRFDQNSSYFCGIHDGRYLAAGLVLTSMVATLAINNTFVHQTRYGTYLRTAVRCVASMERETAGVG